MCRGKGLVLIIIVILLLTTPLIGACTKEVVKEVPVEKTVSVEKTVVQTVQVEKTVTPLKPLPSIMSTTSGGGGTNGEQAIALADQLQKHLGTKFTVQNTGTPANSILLLRSGQAELMVIGTSSLLDPLMGVDDYSSLEWGPQPLRILFSLESTLFGCWTSEKTGIKTYQDIKGKRVAYFPGSSTRNNTIEAIFKAHGFTYDDVKKVNFDSATESYDAVINGAVDVTLGGFKSAKLLEVEATVGLWVIPFSRSAETAQIWKSLQPQPFFEVKKGEFAGVKEDMLLPGSVGYIVTYNFMDDDIAYQLTKGIYGATDDFKNTTVTREWTKEQAIRLPFYGPFHPGAIRFFKEVGLWTIEHEKTQQELLQAEQLRMDAWREQLKTAK